MARPRCCPGSLLILDEAHHAAPVERRPIRHRDEVHARDARPRRRGSSTGCSSRRRRTTVTRTASRRCSSCSIPTASPAACKVAGQEGAGGGDGPPAQGGHPRDPGRLPASARSSQRRHRRPSRRTRRSSCCRGCSTSTATAREERFAGRTQGAAQAAAGLLVVGLQQRLLSSIEAFARSLEGASRRRSSAVRRSQRGGEPPGRRRASCSRRPGADDERAELTHEELEAEERAIEAATPAPSRGGSAEPLATHEQCAARPHAGDRRGARTRPTRRPRADRLDPQAPVPGLAAVRRRASGTPKWTDRRVLIFTENREGTKRYLERDARQAIAGTDRADERIEVITGLPRHARKEIQRRFNTDPRTTRCES